MRDIYMNDGQGFMFVYSIDVYQAEFKDMAALYSKLCHVKGTCDIPIVLVGNKCDLEDRRCVGKNQGENLARQWGKYCSFMEVSAKECINTTEAFYELVHLIQEKEGKINIEYIKCTHLWSELGTYLMACVRVYILYMSNKAVFS